MRNMQDTQAEMEDALIELKVHACFHACASTQPHLELSPSYANDSLYRQHCTDAGQTRML